MRAPMSGNVATVALGVVLGASAVTKLAHMGVFQAVVALSGFVPGPIVPVFSWGIGFAEAATALALIGGRRWPIIRVRAVWGAAFLLTAFLTYDLSRLAFRITLPGPYFGLWSALPPLPEAAIAVAALVLTVLLLSRALDVTAGPEGSPKPAIDRP